MFWVSVAIFLASTVSLTVYGLNFGVDFRGGSIIEIEFLAERPNINEMQEILKERFSDVGEFNISETGGRGITLKSGELSEELWQPMQ